MTKRREAGSCAEVLWDFARAVGRGQLGEGPGDDAARAEGVAQIAKVLGIGPHVVRNILNPDRVEQLSLERAALLSRVFGIDLLARWLAAEAGGTFVPLPTPTGDIERLTAKGVRAAGEAAAQVIEAQSEHSEKGREISADEWRSLKSDCQRVAETFGEMMVLADRGLQKATRDSKGGR